MNTVWLAELEVSPHARAPRRIRGFVLGALILTGEVCVI
jgi:hypothetical protein